MKKLKTREEKKHGCCNFTILWRRTPRTIAMSLVLLPGLINFIICARYDIDRPRVFCQQVPEKRPFPLETSITHTNTPCLTRLHAIILISILMKCICIAQRLVAKNLTISVWLIINERKACDLASTWTFLTTTRFTVIGLHPVVRAGSASFERRL
jgi:hypothetical protein